MPGRINILRLTGIGLFLMLYSLCSAQQEVSVVWYNCENLFDYKDDTLKNDEAFMPTGGYHWTASKYYKKLKRISKVLLAVTEWNTPALIGLCEVENENALKGLIYNSALEALRLNYLHCESGDKRGIDVALLYDRKQFTPIKTQYVKVQSEEYPTFVTRDILYTRGVLLNKDTVHVLVNHWPSKFGGAIATEKFRVLAANTLKRLADSIQQKNKDAYIIAMGDFNETHNDEALQKINRKGLKIMAAAGQMGTHKFRGVWSQIDYFVLSQSLFKKEGNVQYGNWKIAAPDFILEKDEAYNGLKPFRTNIGYRYHGGYSDHLPIVLTLKIKQE